MSVIYTARVGPIEIVIGELECGTINAARLAEVSRVMAKSGKCLIVGLPGKRHVCELVVATIYTIEDLRGSPRIKSEPLLLISNLIGARQVSDVISYVSSSDLRFLYLVSFDKASFWECVEESKAICAGGSGEIVFHDVTCDKELLARMSSVRVRKLVK